MPAAILGGALGAGAAYFFARTLERLPLLTSLIGGPAPPEGMAVHVRQIRRYAFASSQDVSPIVGLTHASYALVLLDTAEEVVGRDGIKAAGYDPQKLRAFITRLQDMHAEKLKDCDSHLQKVLSIERSEKGGQVPGFVLAGPPPSV